jgi:hygromycin-B 7''-O-kinase
MLPARIDPAAFDDLQARPGAWLPDIAPLAQALGGGGLQPAGEGTVLVVLLGTDRVLKVYPPFLQDHFAFERGMLPLLADRLAVPTPRLLADGTHDGWPWLLMTRLAGTPMTTAWPELAEAGRCALLRQIGALIAQVHALPVPASMRPLAPVWADFIARQRAGCAARQQRTGLPAHLLAQLDAFLDGPIPDGPDVLLTGEYTPMNLLVDADDGARLAGMYDFGDGLIGPGAYDWLGPLCFLAAGQPARVAALRDGLGLQAAAWRPDQRHQLLRLMLLHRYSCLRAQLTLDGWQQAPTFEDLADRLWAG